MWFGDKVTQMMSYISYNIKLIEKYFKNKQAPYFSPWFRRLFDDNFLNKPQWSDPDQNLAK